MSRPRKPSALLERTGAHERNHSRRRRVWTVPGASGGGAPQALSCDFEQVWDELVDAVPPVVLGNSDRAWIEITSRLLCEYRRDPECMTGAKLRQLHVFLSKLGMNPSDRSKLSVISEPEPESVEDKYF